MEIFNSNILTELEGCIGDQSNQADFSVYQIIANNTIYHYVFLSLNHPYFQLVSLYSLSQYIRQRPAFHSPRGLLAE